MRKNQHKKVYDKTLQCTTLHCTVQHDELYLTLC